MSNTAERIYNEHAQALFSFVLNVTGSEADTFDILQELFCKAIKSPGLLDGARDERKYLLRLGHNLAIDLMRRRTVREKNHGQLAEVSPLAESPNPDETQVREELACALRDLPPEQRAVAHLKLWEGVTFEEIARILNIPANTAASRYRYAIDKLRDRLRPLYEEIR
jgi:RNA polymerase sigma-70 factor (ECF subfamily)